ncbi:hypothetical protein SEA_MORGANA_131 [Gordonia phage Morgana]|uniref:Uncharacterized protein n=1 Tax=Gordonia phage Morgana TaxID=3137292 RepID=A0AAX4RAY9_9CAUD
MTAARRGDAIVLVQAGRTLYADGRPSQPTTDIEVGIVTSVTRDGSVKAFTDVIGSRQDLARRTSRWHFAQRYILSQDEIDVEAFVAAARARRWPHRPDDADHLPYPFQSLDEARAVARECRPLQAAGNIQPTVI